LWAIDASRRRKKKEKEGKRTEIVRSSPVSASAVQIFNQHPSGSASEKNYQGKKKKGEKERGGKGGKGERRIVMRPLSRRDKRNCERPGQNTQQKDKQKKKKEKGKKKEVTGSVPGRPRHLLVTFGTLYGYRGTAKEEKKKKGGRRRKKKKNNKGCGIWDQNS